MILNEEINLIFRHARHEVFEAGMDSIFSRDLESIIHDHGKNALTIIAELISDKKTNMAVAEEALRILGRIDDPATHDIRLNILTSAIASEDLRLRDSAYSGLESLDDPAAIPVLQTAIENEKSDFLRRYLMQVVYYLSQRE